MTFNKAFNGYSLPSSPLWYNPLFLGGETLKLLKTECGNNLNQVGHIVDSGKIITLNNLKSQFGLTDFN